MAHYFKADLAADLAVTGFTYGQGPGPPAITGLPGAAGEISRSEEIQAAREHERRRIAMELHDSTGQQLVAIGLGLSRLRAALNGRADTIDALDDLAQNLAEAQRDIRTLSFLINPPGAQVADAGAALRAFAEGFARRAQIELRLDVRLPPDTLDDEDRHVLFRTVQEGLVNVHRHAGATKVEVLARQRCGTLRCEVRDNGRGFPRNIGGGVGEGLHAMGSRVAALGGGLTIRNTSPGAAILASWPVAQARRRLTRIEEIDLRVG